MMLTGTYPYEDAEGRQVLVMRKIMKAQYTLPHGLQLSGSCLDLIAQMFNLDPVQRISIAGIKQHPWYTAAQPQSLEASTLQPPAMQEQRAQPEAEVVAVLIAAKTRN